VLTRRAASDVAAFVVTAGCFVCLLFAYASSYHAVWTTAALTGFAICAGLISLRSRLRIIAPIVVFSGFGVMYGLPFALTFLAGGRLIDERDFASQWIPKAMWLHALALGSTVVGYLFALSTRRPRNSNAPVANDTGAAWCNSSLRLVATLAGALGVLGLLTFLATAGGVGTLQTLSYANRGLAMRGYGILLLGLLLVSTAGLLLYYDALIVGKRSRARLVLVLAGGVMAGWMLISLSRGALIRFVVSLVVIRALAGYRLTRLQAVIGGVALTAATLLHSSIGRRLSLDVVTQIDWRSVPLFVFNPASGEFGSTMPTVADILAWFPAGQDFRWGATYLEALGVLVPLAIWPDRPLAVGEWYAAHFYSAVWEQGGAFGFSPVAEAYMNFATPGVVLIFFLFGALLYLTEYAILRRPLGPVAFLFALAVPWLAFFWRFDWASILKNYFLFTAAVVFAMRVAAEVVRGISSAARATRPVEEVAAARGH
jgi:oligosaccharide repeat unit polymerase